MKRLRKTDKELKKLADQIIKHYFNYPGMNGYKNIATKFNVNESFIRKVLSSELEKRFKAKHNV